MTIAAILTLATACLALSVAVTRLVLGWLRRRQIMDVPNDRSSHSRPTPRGGGLAVTPVALLGLGVLAVLGAVPSGVVVVLAAAAALLGLSWVDDRRSLPARLRLGLHLAAAAAGLATFPADALVFQGLLPFWADRLAALLAWGWFINLYNFMDGIDGITGIETASLGLGLALVGWVAGQPDLPPAGLVLAAVALGFLVWNWHPAKLFLGDSGSVPLGYLLGWLLLLAAARGAWAPALILPLYYLADATLTLSRRALAGQRIWQAHRQHFYQRVVAAGHSHAAVSLAVLGCNAALALCALVSLHGHAYLGVAAGLAVAAGFLALLAGRAKPFVAA